MIIRAQVLNKGILTCLHSHPPLRPLPAPLFFTSLTASFTHSPMVDDYEVTGFIGKGSSSMVYQGYNVITKESVIIKMFKDIIKKDKINREIRINQVLADSGHVVPLIEVLKDEGCGSIALIFKNLHGLPFHVLHRQLSFMKKL
jgi:serine/threonine protein kinase